MLILFAGKEIVDLVLDRLRKIADNCTGLQVITYKIKFLINHVFDSVSGL